MNPENIDEWSNSLIEQHRNPIVRVNISQEKKLKEDSSDVEEIDLRLSHLEKLLSSTRVEIKNKRSLGVWDPHLQLVVMTKSRNLPKNIGFKNAKGHFLYPFEALFLLETNRLEVIEEEIPWSIYKAYKTLLSGKDDFDKYVTYRKYALLGIAINLIPTDKQNAHNRQAKRMKRCNEPSSTTTVADPVPSSSTQELNYKAIFQNLKPQGPTVYCDADSSRSDERNPQWLLKSSGSKSHKLNFLSTKRYFNSKQIIQTKGADLFELPSTHDIALRIKSMNLEDLGN